MRSLQWRRRRCGRGEVELICGTLRLLGVAYVVRRCVRLEQAAKARTASALTRGQRASRHSKAGSRARVCTPAPVTPRQRCSVRALNAGAHLLSLCTQGWVQREVVSKQALASRVCHCTHVSRESSWIPVLSKHSTESTGKQDNKRSAKTC